MARQTTCTNCNHKILLSHENRVEQFYPKPGTDDQEEKYVWCTKPECVKAWVVHYRTQTGFACNIDESCGMAEQ